MPPSGQAPLTSAQLKKKYGIPASSLKPKGGNSIMGFLGHAAHVVRTNAVEWEKKDLKRSWGYAKKIPAVGLGVHIAKGDTKAVKQELKNEVAYDSVQRIRKGKGTTMDKITVGLMAAPVVGKGFSLAAREAAAAQPFRILSPGVIARGIEHGEIALDVPTHMSKLSKNAVLNRMFKGVPVSWAGDGSRKGRFVKLKEHPDQPGVSDNVVENRVPFLTNKKTGEVLHGELGQVHGDIASTIATRRMLARGINPRDNRNMFWSEIDKVFAEHRQGFIHHPIKGKMRIETGFGKDVGYPQPDSTLGLTRLLNHLTHEFDDTHVRNMDQLGDFRLGGKHQPQSTAGMTEREIQDKAFEQFLLDEKMVTHQGARWRDEIVDATEDFARGYNPREVDWSKIKTGADWNKFLQGLKGKPRDYAFGEKIGPHKGGPFGEARAPWIHQDPNLPPTPKGGRKDYEDGMAFWNERRAVAHKNRVQREADEADSGLQRLVKGMAQQTRDIEAAKKWWGRKIGGAYPNEETLLMAYHDNNAKIAAALKKKYNRKR